MLGYFTLNKKADLFFNNEIKSDNIKSLFSPSHKDFQPCLNAQIYFCSVKKQINIQTSEIQWDYALLCKLKKINFNDIKITSHDIYILIKYKLLKGSIGIGGLSEDLSNYVTEEKIISTTNQEIYCYIKIDPKMMPEYLCIRNVSNDGYSELNLIDLQIIIVDPIILNEQHNEILHQALKNPEIACQKLRSKFFSELPSQLSTSMPIKLKYKHPNFEMPLPNLL